VRFLGGLNGLRAVAILGVLLYHLSSPWMVGGFLGVDVFFVISGFLITALLLTELQDKGRIDLARFYLRRARRLLPALFTVLVATALWAVLFRPDLAYGLRKDTIAAAGYVSNWWFILENRSYFEVMAQPQLLGHLWSLAIEEQFYLLWPVALLLLMRTGGPRRLGLVALGGAVVSTALMAVLAVLGDEPLPHDPSRLYFGTDTHSFGLLIGAALAVVWTGHRPEQSVRWQRWLFNLVGAGSLSVVVWSFIHVSEFSERLYRGGFLLFCVTVALLIAAAVYPGTVVERLMSLRPLQWIGDRSYGLYLWHWPVFLLLRPRVDIPLSGLPNAAVRLSITFLLASLTYRWIEQPFRRGRVLAQLRERGTFSSLPQLAKAVPPFLTAVLLTTVAVSGLAHAVPPAEPEGQVVVAPVIDRPDTLPQQTARGGPSHHHSGGHGKGHGGGGATPEQPGHGEHAGGHPAGHDGGQDGHSHGQGHSPSRRLPPVLAVGDSVLIAASAALRADIGQVRVVAEVGMQTYELRDRLDELADSGPMRPVVVMHTGSNGIIDPDDLHHMLELLEGEKVVVVVNVSVPRPWEGPNDQLLREVVPQYDNTVLVDWKSETARHPDDLGDDDVHPGATGAAAYADLVKQAMIEGLTRA
jgi:peptidoglycan/LPS O-acetylase OafA/YrhL